MVIASYIWRLYMLYRGGSNTESPTKRLFFFSFFLFAFLCLSFCGLVGTRMRLDGNADEGGNTWVSGDCPSCPSPYVCAYLRVADVCM